MTYTNGSTHVPQENESQSVFGELTTWNSGSPRWLQIVRDVVITIVGLIIIGTILVLIGLRAAGNSLDEITNPDPTPTATCFIPDDPSCVTPGG